MSKALDDYLLLLNGLIRVRWLYSGMESDEEDRLLDEMDIVWLNLTDEERVKIQALPSKSIIVSQPKKILQDTPLQSPVHRELVDTPEHREAA